jgi:SAM-dependent methyltransferase
MIAIRFQDALTHLYRWACERLYAEWAWSYDWVSWLVSFGRWSTWRRTALRTVAPLDPAHPPLRILELGFGTGHLLADLARAGHHVYGLDRSAVMPLIAARTLARAQTIAPCVQGQGQRMPFADQSFDVIVTTFPAPFLLEEATLRECARLLSAPSTARTALTPTALGGQMVVVGLWVTLSPRWLGRWLPFFYGDPSDELMTMLRQRFAAAGFTVTDTTHTDRPFAVGSIIAHFVQ